MNKPRSNEWSANESHPSTELLFIAMEGELNAQETARVQKHVELCWRCRAQWEKWQEATSAFVDYRGKLHQTQPSSPPSGWSRFRTQLRQLATEGDQRRSIFKTPIRGILATGWQRFATNGSVWAGLAVASLVMAAFTYLYLATTPAVSAKELLVRAVAQEKPLVQRVCIRTKSREYVRHAGQSGAHRATARTDAEETRLATLFQQANLDWDNPLSARSFERWHSRLNEKTDRVYKAPHGLTLETKTSDWPIQAAALTIRSTDFHPIQETIHFADAEEVEITELEARPMTASEIASASAPPEEKGSTPAPGLKVHHVLSILPSTAELEAAEVTARVKLHELGADLGQQLDIARTKDSVKVSGVVDSTTEKRQIAAALNGIPLIQTSLSSPEDIRLDGLEQALRTAPPASSVRQAPLLAAWLEQRYPDPAALRHYTDEVLTDSRECLRRAYALQHLAERYPTLDNQQISAIAKDHLLVLQEKWQILLKTVAPVLEVPSPPASTADTSWPSDAETLLASIKEFDSSLIALFVGKEAEAGNEQGMAGVAGGEIPDLQAVLTKSRTQAQIVTQALTRLLQAR